MNVFWPMATSCLITLSVLSSTAGVTMADEPVTRRTGLGAPSSRARRGDVTRIAGQGHAGERAGDVQIGRGPPPSAHVLTAEERHNLVRRLKSSRCIATCPQSGCGSSDPWTVCPILPLHRPTIPTNLTECSISRSTRRFSVRTSRNGSRSRTEPVFVQPARRSTCASTPARDLVLWYELAGRSRRVCRGLSCDRGDQAAEPDCRRR